MPWSLEALLVSAMNLPAALFYLFITDINGLRT